MITLPVWAFALCLLGSAAVFAGIALLGTIIWFGSSMMKGW